MARRTRIVYSGNILATFQFYHPIPDRKKTTWVLIESNPGPLPLKATMAPWLPGTHWFVEKPSFLHLSVDQTSGSPSCMKQCSLLAVTNWIPFCEKILRLRDTIVGKR